MNKQTKRLRRTVAAYRAAGGLLLGILATPCAVLPVSGQPFSNLDFESAGNGAIPADAVWLGWRLAAPGWQHAAGADTVFVYHAPREGRTTQCYFLVDGTAKDWSPLAGNFSFGLESGRYSSVDPNSSWVYAAITQTGVVPTNARSFTMLARGDVEVTLNGTPISLSPMGGDLFGGDISAFAGQTATLAIINKSTELNAPLVVDNIQFSPSVVPEPSSFSLLVAGVLCVLLARKLRRSELSPRLAPIRTGGRESRNQKRG